MKLKKKILLIEDDPDLGVTLQNILSLSNYDVCYVTNGASGVQKAFQFNPDFILCDINMYPVDGYQVFKLLEESSILSHIPFVFLTGSAELNDIRYGMALGADDYLIKPVLRETLIQTIEKRLEKFSAIQEEARQSFNRLFDLSPIGMVLFDGVKILKANPAFKKLAGIKGEEIELSLSNILEEESYSKVVQGIQNLKNKHQEQVIGNLQFSQDDSAAPSGQFFIVEFDRFTNSTLYLGVYTSDTEKNGHSGSQEYVKEIYKLLKRENIKISDALGQKIMELFKDTGKKIQNPADSIFTARENQILNLSMEGLPIKIIAERLNISDRTVEKHRTKLMEKTGAGNIIEVIIFALKNNLVEI